MTERIRQDSECWLEKTKNDSISSFLDTRVYVRNYFHKQFLVENRLRK